MSRGRLAGIVRYQVQVDRQPRVVVLEMVVGTVRFDSTCLAPARPGAAGAEQEGDAEERAHGADHGPQGLAGHERPTDGADSLAEPDGTDKDQEDADHEPRPHAVHVTASRRGAVLP